MKKYTGDKHIIKFKLKKDEKAKKNLLDKFVEGKVEQT